MDKPSRYSLNDGQWINGTPYRVVRALGLGGMGEVYEVDHTRTGTRRAIKLLRDVVERQGNPARRLIREGIALASIDHPNVVRVYEVDALPDGRPYFAMQLLEGCTFRTLTSREPGISVGRALHLAVQALRGLEAVHARNIIHRDVKPTNLFVCRGDVVKVLDFGVAKLIDVATGSTRTAEGLVLGTIRYMAPEQLCGAAVTCAADVYSMGLVVFELVTGNHAFCNGAGGEKPFMARLREPAPRLSTRTRVPLPRGLDDVVARALERDPQDRYASAREFADALQACAGSDSVVATLPALGAPPSPVVSVRWPGEPTIHDGSEAPTTWLPRPIANVPRTRHRSSMLRVGLTASACSLLFAGAVAAIVYGVTRISAAADRVKMPQSPALSAGFLLDGPK